MRSTHSELRNLYAATDSPCQSRRSRLPNLSSCLERLGLGIFFRRRVSKPMLSSRQEEIGANQGNRGLHLLRIVALLYGELPIFVERFVQCQSRLQRIQKPHDFGLRAGRFGPSVLNAIPREPAELGIFNGRLAQSGLTTLS